MQIIIGNKEQRSGYFEVGYTFVLTVPQSQVSKAGLGVTKEVTGVAGFKDGTDIKDIQTNLIERFNKAQEELNSDTKFELYGMTYDGERWI